MSGIRPVSGPGSPLNSLRRASPGTTGYHQRPSLPATLFDIGVGALTAIRLCRRHAIPLIHARSHVAAAMALPAQSLLGCSVLFDIRGLLAEEYVDAGRWAVGDLKYRLTKAMERVFFRRADAFVMLTRRIKDELTSTDPALQGRANEIEVIPCCVNLDRFSIGPVQRQSYRAGAAGMAAACSRTSGSSAPGT